MFSLGRFTSVHKPVECGVLITGGSRGIGNFVAHHLVCKGYTVIVTVRKGEHLDEFLKRKEINKPIPVLLDVTKDEHVEPAVELVKSVLKRKNVKLVAIVNNAGIDPEADRMFKENFLGNNTLSDPSIGSCVFETNVIGVARVTRAFLPELIAGGRIVNIGSYFGSIAGKLGMGHAYYEASKFAIEGLTINMRKSLKSRGIEVILIKPGNILTDMNARGEGNSLSVAESIEHAISSRYPNPRYFPGTVRGFPTRFLCLLFELLPTKLTDSL